MAAVTITPSDLAPFAEIDEAKAEAMIADALAIASRVAPCINEASFEHAAAAKAILRGAILRWHEVGSGAVTQTVSGPFSQTIDTRSQRRGMFWPTEINDLAGLCSGTSAGRAFEVDTMPPGAMQGRVGGVLG